MINERLNRLQIGVIYITLAIIILGILAVAAAPLNNYLTINFGNKNNNSKPQYRNWTQNDTIPSFNNINNYTLVKLYNGTYYNLPLDKYVFYVEVYNKTGVLKGKIILWWRAFNFSTQKADSGSDLYYKLDNLSTKMSGTGSGNDKANINIGGGYLNLIKVHVGQNYNYYINLKFSDGDTPMYFSVYAVYIPVKNNNSNNATPTLNLGFMINIIIAFAAIYMILKGIYYIGWIRV